MKILITGAGGFLGSALTSDLSKRGHDVFALVRESTKPTKIDKLRELGAQPIVADFTQIAKTDEWFENNYVDFVIHAATNYGRKQEEVTEVFSSNLILPLQILKRIKKSAWRTTFINVDSFFNKEGKIYSPLIDYSLSKKSLLDWLIYFSKDIAIFNMRLEHIYGPGDSESKFIPTVIGQLLADQPQKIALSPGNQIRDFVYIDDVVSALCILIEKSQVYTSGGFKEFQVGTGIGTSVKDLVLKLKLLSKSNATLLFGDLPYRNDEIMSSVSDMSFQRNFDWSPKTSLELGLIKSLKSTSL